MNWRHDPRLQKSLEKATLESLFKKYFQSIYGNDEVQEMENALRNALNKYEKKDTLFQKLMEIQENEAEPLMQECLNSLCEKTMNRGQDHTPESMLTLSKLFIKIADFRLACEALWCSASIAVQEFITTRQLKVKLHSHNGKRDFVRALSREIGNQFAVFEACHSSFYTNSHNARDVNAAFVEANDFVQQLRAYHLTDEKKKELEKDNFNY
ncbi:hypothetical protein PRIPAC_86011 [Pristionchus pacificus]|uniref:Uncharacterized protein n=1 Tax=Pristionchus pacificus TaxID=54126 RepID=A0A2A6BKG4_PRIPA|nr:hypothetical protein PRIPAC_86011 [Pristionchus pacificus]|eukprot:PDM66405.1 hypothetical protein PRIPAC_47822 [Pristionchus pacificus]